jgi:hypothetical protein
MLMMVVSFVGVLLMATTVVMSGYLLEDTKAALIAQSKGIPPIDPAIEIQMLYPKKPIPSHLAVGLERGESIFVPMYYSLQFLVNNRGQRGTGNIRFRLSDPLGFFYAKMLMLL